MRFRHMTPLVWLVMAGAVFCLAGADPAIAKGRGHRQSAPAAAPASGHGRPSLRLVLHTDDEVMFVEGPVIRTRGVARVWLAMLMRHDENDDGGPHILRSLFEIDCHERREKVLKSIEYSPDLEPGEQSDKAGDWDYAEPDQDWDLETRICAGRPAAHPEPVPPGDLAQLFVQYLYGGRDWSVVDVNPVQVTLVRPPEGPGEHGEMGTVAVILRTPRADQAAFIVETIDADCKDGTVYAHRLALLSSGFRTVYHGSQEGDRGKLTANWPVEMGRAALCDADFFKGHPALGHTLLEERGRLLATTWKK